MTTQGRRSTVVEFPSALEILFTREFEASREDVFDVLTKPEHVRHWGATGDDRMTACAIDLRVGGSYRMTLVTDDATECSFSGTYLEIQRPTKIVDTWLFEGWPGAEALETVELREAAGVTRLTMTLAFRDQAGRDHMTRFDGQQDSYDAIEECLRSLLESKGTVPGDSPA